MLWPIMSITCLVVEKSEHLAGQGRIVACKPRNTLQVIAVWRLALSYMGNDYSSLEWFDTIMSSPIFVKPRESIPMKLCENIDESKSIS